MDSCMTCKEYPDCTTRLGCNLVGCVGWKPVDNLNYDSQIESVDKGICNDCMNLKICNFDMRNQCLRPSKYVGYFRALKHKNKIN